MKEWVYWVIGGVLFAAMMAALFWALYDWCFASIRQIGDLMTLQAMHEERLRAAEQRLHFDMGRPAAIPPPQVPAVEP